MALSPDQQLKPLAPFISSTRFTTQEDEQQQQHQQKKKMTCIRNFVLCFGCFTALAIILVVVVIVLAFTVYNVQEPKVRLNTVTLVNGTFGDAAKTNTNVTFIADMTVKNPNAFSFRFGESTTTFYYDGRMIGEGRSPSGKAKARRTIKMNSTLEIMAQKFSNIPTLQRDLADQSLNISSYTRIDGKVKILNIFARGVVVEMNCTVAYNVTTGFVSHGDNCLGNVDM